MQKLTLCWRLSLLLSYDVQNWLLGMKQNIFHTHHLTTHTGITMIIQTSSSFSSAELSLSISKLNWQIASLLKVQNVLTSGDPVLISASSPPRYCRCDHRRGCFSQKNTPEHCWGSGWAPSHCPPTRCPASYLSNMKMLIMRKEIQQTQENIQHCKLPLRLAQRTNYNNTVNG